MIDNNILFFGTLAIIGVVYFLYFRSQTHNKLHAIHCEKTSFVEGFLLLAFITSLVFWRMLNTVEILDWVFLFGIASVGGLVGVILYRKSRGKKILGF